MISSARDLFQLRADGLRIQIEKLQRTMNKHLNNGRCIREIEKKQSRLRVDMKIYERKILIIDQKFKRKAA
jgi:hypothetical protein